MKLIIEKNVLLENLTNVMRAISTYNIIPILNGVKFELKKEGLFLTASDSEFTIQNFIDKKEIKNIKETGTIVIQSKYLLDIIKKLPNGDINIEVVDGLKIVISAEKTVFNLNCLNTEDYPEIKFEEVKNPVIIESNLLKETINQTLFAISNQQSRPILTGANFILKGQQISCITTDSYRVAKKTINLDEEYDSFNIVIPGKSLNELDKIISEENPVEIHPFNNKIIFKYKNYILQSNLLSGSFPNVTDFIPTDPEFIIKTSLLNFTSAIDRAALLTQSKDKNIVNIETKQKEMLISSFASEIGKVEDSITIDKSTKEDISISFSSKYMLDALKTFNEDEILILLTTDIKPIILKSIKDESLIQIIVPIKTY